MTLPVPVKITPAGAASQVEVDGQEISHLVKRVSYDHRYGQFPEVFLELKADVKPDAIECEAVVTVTAPGEDVIAWLSNIDPSELERESLAALEMGGPQTFGQAAVEVLGRWARGQ